MRIITHGVLDKFISSMYVLSQSEPTVNELGSKYTLPLIIPDAGGEIVLYPESSVVSSINT